MFVFREKISGSYFTFSLFADGFTVIKDIYAYGGKTP